MIKIALYDIDRTGFPNLALMKISAWHKSKGDEVEMFQPLSSKYDKLYASKVFTYLPDWYTPTKRTELGGTGYGLFNTLPDEIEHMCPDYGLYGITDVSYGFLTRGCIRNCPWCIVPRKEGRIRPHAEIEEFLRHNSVILMDNNVLAHEHGIKQIEKIAKMGIKVDFNQGLDSRLIDDSIASLLAKVKWLKPVRLACDTYESIQSLEKAVKILRWHNVRPLKYFVYVLVTEDIQGALERIKVIKGLYLDPFAQPLRNGKEPTQKQKDFARWVNHKAIFNSVSYDQYCKYG
jgi:hypothetical protein